MAFSCYFRPFISRLHFILRCVFSILSLLFVLFFKIKTSSSFFQYIPFLGLVPETQFTSVKSFSTSAFTSPILFFFIASNNFFILPLNEQHYQNLPAHQNYYYFLNSQYKYNGIFFNQARVTDICSCSSSACGSFKSVMVNPVLIKAFT